VPVDLRRVGQQRGQLEHVALDLELDARHVAQHRAEPARDQARLGHLVVDTVQVDRRVLLAQPVDVFGQPVVQLVASAHPTGPPWVVAFTSASSRDSWAGAPE
jgi:hypothetical protein